MLKQEKQKCITASRIQVAAIAIPWINDVEIKFCRFLEWDPSAQIGDAQSYVFAQFGKKRPQFLFAPSIVQMDLENLSETSLQSNFNFGAIRDCKKNRSFVRFLCEINKGSILCFVLSSKLKKSIEIKCKKKEFMQIFEVSFDHNFQTDPTLEISTMDSGASDLLFKSDFAGFFAFGKIEDHYSFTINEYEERTGHDPVYQYANSIYYDSVMHKFFCGEDFESYLGKVRERLR